MMTARKVKEDIVLEERIDRNGTRHQVIETSCNRCGGQGGSSKWMYTGVTCFKCGGHGRMTAKRKIYTPEHRAKLDAQREKREEKKRQQIMAEAVERNKEYLINAGYNQEKIYVVKGNTFEIKEELKEAGARFNKQVMGWFFTEENSSYETYSLETEKLLKYDGFGQVELNYFDEDVREYIKSVRDAGKIISKFVGDVGEKIEMEFEVLKSFWIEGYYGSTCINKMMDGNGNIFIWKTGKDMENESDDNMKIKLKGTIKDHSEYNEEKQTVLTRCKIIK